MIAPLTTGDVLAGKYAVERILGEGGMGVVVAAIHQQLGQRVAVKFLLPTFCEHPEAVARFLREAQAAVRIQSEHVARVIDVGTLETGAPYMVMEFLSGRDLASELAARGTLPVDEAVTYVLQACEAIAEAHALGIVHRDLKPANLFLSRRADGSALVKVLDFGISKSTGAGGTPMNLTSTQSVMGSPLYMSPEQLKSTKNVDQRTDIWALGVILHELLCGEPPFRSDTVSGLIATVVSEPAPPLRALRADLPAELEHVVLRCLEKDPARRIAHVGTLTLALTSFAPTQAAISVPRIKGVLQAAGVDTSSNLGSLVPPAKQAVTAAAFGHDARPREANSRLGLLLGAGLSLGAIAVVGGVVGLRSLGTGAAGSPSASVASVAAEPAALPPSLTIASVAGTPSTAPSTSAARTASDPVTSAKAPSPSVASGGPTTASATAVAPTSRATSAPRAATTRRTTADPLDGRR